MKNVKLTSLPFSTSTFAKRAIKPNLGIPPCPGSATGFSESLTSCINSDENKDLVRIDRNITMYFKGKNANGRIRLLLSPKNSDAFSYIRIPYKFQILPSLFNVQQSKANLIRFQRLTAFLRF